MVKIVIEFFHDVLCSWCYAFSPKVRRLVESHPEVEVIHRCFALAPTPDSIMEIFGSKERAKREILRHWQQANENDDLHRLRPRLMAQRDFDYPYSMPGLKACKAAEMQGGQKVHWEMFDRVQKAHLTECRNIADFEVLKDCANEIGLDITPWERYFRSEICEQPVYQDLKLALEYGVSGVPTLITQGTCKLVGAHKMESLEKWFELVKDKVSRAPRDMPSPSF